MHGGEPLRDDASIRDFNGGVGCHIASAIEEALLLPKDMAEIKNARKNDSSSITKDIWEWYNANSLLFLFVIITH